MDGAAADGPEGLAMPQALAAAGLDGVQSSPGLQVECGHFCLIVDDPFAALVKRHLPAF
jgi:hypothetical protein